MTARTLIIGLVMSGSVFAIYLAQGVALWWLFAAMAIGFALAWMRRNL
jgi:hypothetical protein